MKDVDVKWTSI